MLRSEEELDGFGRLAWRVFEGVAAAAVAATVAVAPGIVKMMG